MEPAVVTSGFRVKTGVRSGTRSGSKPKKLEARPRCAVCEKPVEELTEEESFGRVVFTARCHGKTEVVRVEGDMVRGVDFGLAFIPKNVLPVALAPKLLSPSGTVACPGCGHLTPADDAPPGYRVVAVLSCSRCGYGKSR